MILRRFRFWEYPNGVVVEIPVDAPDARPPKRLEDVPATWKRTQTTGPAGPPKRGETSRSRP